ncbi:MAG: ABC transporter permease [Oscillospiraceae bacterium]|nr:ABC transporter permease [Oscillospiraceae bacterium]
MRAYIIRRILQIIPVFLGILIILFMIIELSPGGPMGNYIDPKMRPEMKEALAEKFGLNDPPVTRFFKWIGATLQGDLGQSIKFLKPVTEVLRPMIGPSLALSSLSLLLAMLVGIPAGIVSATKQYTLADNSLTVFSLIGISMPSFFFALLLLKFFSVDLGLFPLFGLRNPLYNAPNIFAQMGHMLWHLALPTVVLGLGSTATFMRYTRSSMLEVIRSDYIRTARAKGLAEKVVIYRHAFRNAVIPIITLLGFWIPALLSGAVITESIFGLPGLGKISVEAVMYRDYPIILAINAMLAMLTLLSTIIADILYAAADPRIKYN